MLLLVLSAGCTTRLSRNLDPGDIRGRAVLQDPGGALLPVAGARVRLGPGAVLTRTDAAGSFSLRGVPPGTHELRIEQSDASGKEIAGLRVPVELPPDDGLDLGTLLLGRLGEVRGRVTRGGVPVARVSVALDGVRAVESGAEGGFAFPELYPGRYVVVAVAGETSPRVPVVVADGAVVEVVLELSGPPARPGRVWGYARAVGRSEHASIAVRLAPATGVAPLEATTDVAGAWSIGEVPGGIHALTARAGWARGGAASAPAFFVDGDTQAPDLLLADLAEDGRCAGDGAAEDGDEDGVRDLDEAPACLCDPNGSRDDDADGICDTFDPDDDGDRVPDTSDNCPASPNPAQDDADGNGRGDRCQPGRCLAANDAGEACSHADDGRDGVCVDVAGTLDCRLPEGETCPEGGACASGACVTGICCEAACEGPCATCVSPDASGTCVPRVAGSACTGRDGGAGTCPGIDIADACVVDLGQACSGDDTCATGSCVDGVCCERACEGTCESCTVPGFEGTCAPEPSGAACLATDGRDATCDGARACVLAIGDACSAGGECSSGSCVDGVCCNTGCDAACETCAADGRRGTCTPEAVGVSCFGGTGACAASGEATTCLLLAGLECNTGAECLTGRCVDGVCCGSACDGTCESCALPSSKGTCALEASGAACVGPGSQAGACVVTASVAACVLPLGATCTAGVECASGRCVDGVCCNGACAGSCERCDLAGTAGACTPESSGSSCVGLDAAVGTCLNTGTTATCVLGLGVTCVSGGDCASGSCVDGVCCDTACTGTCETCALAGRVGSCSPDSAGTACTGAGGFPGSCGTGSTARACLLPLGTSCTASAACASGRCVDGVCCGSACAGSCESCALPGLLGTCSAEPSGAACTGTGGASGSCGSGATSRQCLLPLGTACTGGGDCASGTCDSGLCCDRTCGAECFSCALPGSEGTCTVEPAGTSCTGFGGGAGQCGSGATSGACLLPLGSACLADTDCAGARCVDGVCCDGACAGTCESCALSASRGTCSPDLPGTACTGPGGQGGRCDTGGSGACLLTNGATCTAGSACESGFCVDGRCCNSACTGTCATCNGATTAGACTNEAVGTACVASGGRPGTCSATATCLLGTGATCSLDNECASSRCVDGVCCTSACGGTCESCALAGQLGTCGAIAAGLDPANECAASECTTGACSGARACGLQSAGTQCGSAGECTATGTCTDFWGRMRLPMAHQRTTARAAGRWWHFFTLESSVAVPRFAYTSSADGVTWTLPVELADVPLPEGFGGGFLTAASSGTQVSYAASDGVAGTPLRVRSGTATTGGTINWLAAQQNGTAASPSTTRHFRLQSMMHPTLGSFYGYNPNGSGNWAAWLSANTSTNGLWTTRAGFPFSLATRIVIWVVIPAVLDNGEVWTLMSGDFNLRERKWNGSTWTTATVIFASDYPGASVSALAGTAHVLHGHHSGALKYFEVTSAGRTTPIDLATGIVRDRYLLAEEAGTKNLVATYVLATSPRQVTMRKRTAGVWGPETACATLPANVSLITGPAEMGGGGALVLALHGTTQVPVVCR